MSIKKGGMNLSEKSERVDSLIWLLCTRTFSKESYKSLNKSLAILILSPKNKIQYKNKKKEKKNNNYSPPATRKG